MTILPSVRSAAIAIIAAIVLQAKAGAACPHVTQSGGRDQLVQRINSSGFDAFAGAVRGDDAEDVGLSPLVTWYLDQFIAYPPPEPLQSVTSLLTSYTKATDGIALSGSVWADEIGTTYDTVKATIVDRNLCVPTTWRKWDANADGAASPLKSLMVAWLRDHGISGTLTTDYGFWNYYVFNALASLSTRATFGQRLFAAQPYVRAPFYDGGDIHGVRFDTEHNELALDMFWGSKDAIVKFRKTLNARTSASTAAAFTMATVSVADFSFSRELYAEIPAATGDVFGASVAPGFTVQNAIAESMALSVDGNGISLTVGGALHGLPDNYGQNFVSQSDRDPGVPESRRFSALSPMLYIVEDKATGVILLLGSHE